MNSFRGSGICPLNPKAILPEKLIPASVYVRVESDDDPNESNLALQSDSSSLDDSNSNPVEPSTSSGSASIGDQIDPDACNSSTCSSSANISEQIDIYSYQVEPSTSSGSASIGDQIDPDACNSSTCSSSANISEQIDIDSACEELVNYEMEIPFEGLLLFEQQYIEGTNVEDPVFSQWIFLKSQLEHLEFLSQCNDLRKPVPAPSQVKLEELERNMPPGMNETFEKRLAEGFDMDIDPLYSCWKQLKTSSSSSEHSIHSSPKPLRVLRLRNKLIYL